MPHPANSAGNCGKACHKVTCAALRLCCWRSDTQTQACTRADTRAEVLSSFSTAQSSGWQDRRKEARPHLATELTRTGARPETLSLPLEHAGSGALALIPSSAVLLDTGSSCSSGSLAMLSAGPSAAKAALPRFRLSPCAAAASKRPGAGGHIVTPAPRSTQRAAGALRKPASRDRPWLSAVGVPLECSCPACACQRFSFAKAICVIDEEAHKRIWQHRGASAALQSRPPANSNYASHVARTRTASEC